MEASSVTRGLLARADVRGWAWWQLPWVLRCYVGVVPLVAAVLTCVAAINTTWYAADAWKFALLLGCSLISVAATPRVVYRQSGVTRDFITVWVLPIAILLPPFYAMVTPIPIYVLTQFWVSPGHRLPPGVHRRRDRPGFRRGVAAVPRLPGLVRRPGDRHRPARPDLGRGGRDLRAGRPAGSSAPDRGRDQAHRSDGTVRRPGVQPRGAGGRLRRVRPQHPDHHRGRGERRAGHLRRAHGAAGPALHDARAAARPVQDRHQDRPAQRVDLGAGGDRGDCPRRPDRDPARPRAGRHRPLQAGQRHPRPPGRRQGAARGHRRAAQPAARLRPGRAVRRRGVRHPAPACARGGRAQCRRTPAGPHRQPVHPDPRQRRVRSVTSRSPSRSGSRPWTARAAS